MIWHEFQRPSQVQPEEEEQTEIFGRFLAQPFERGWGTTVGNALRRALLSSIPGAAITAVKIEGADHEFSAVPGVVEGAQPLRGCRLAIASGENVRQRYHQPVAHELNRNHLRQPDSVVTAPNASAHLLSCS